MAAGALSTLTMPTQTPASAANPPGSWQADQNFAQTPEPFTAISCGSGTNCVGVGTAGVATLIIEGTTNDGASWTAEKAPSGVETLEGISCPSATDCTAVGSTATENGTPVAIGTTNGGATWTLEKTPTSPSSLDAVSCASTTTCVAVGSGSGLMTTNGGTTWTSVSPGGDDLEGISCPSASTCVAVGSVGQTGTCTHNPLPGCPAQPYYAWTTNGGTSWSESGAGSSNSTSGGSLTSVSCPTTTQCMVAGAAVSGTLSPSTATEDVVVLSGSCTMVGCGGSGIPSLSSVNVLDGVSCPSSSLCVAVGDGQIATAGASPTTQDAPIGVVSAVSCASASDCMAAGATSGSVAAIASSTDGGSSWAAAFIAPYGVDDLDAVSCPTTSVCTAVGGTEGGFAGFSVTGPGAVVNSTDGGATWTEQSLPADAGALGAISCASTSVCEALGTTTSSNPEILGTTNGGTTWQDQAVPAGFGTGGQLSCPSTSDCTAVSGGTVIGTTDGGTTWAAETVPAGEDLDAVACTSTTSCTAVGSDTNTSGPGIVATSDGGNIWTAQTPPSGSSGSLISIACPSSATCIALGWIVNQSFPIISTTDGGTTWTMPGDISESPNVYELDQLACSSTTACVVVGEATVNDGPGIVEATSNGGSTWATQSAPTSSLAFKGVVCPAADGCIAVGDGADASGAVVIGQAPITRVVIPVNGATVSGNSAVLDATASSPEGMSTVKFEVSGGLLSDQVVAAATPTIYGWLAQWNTTAVPNGSYSVQSVATDDEGTTVTSGAVSVTVDNAAPSTSVLIPSNGADQSGASAVLDASASSNVTSVSFQLSGGSLSDQVVATATPTIYGWLAQWNTTSVPNGNYNLQSVASYAGGVSGTSSPISVTIDNAAPSTSVLIPSSGADQSGTSAVLDASASSNVSSVSFVLSGGSLVSSQTIAQGTLTEYGWLAEWNTTSVPDATYTLESVASYAGGVSGTSSPTPVTVDN
jgi:photosystem II stability/assembly factor-like uncharacterized protein